MIKLVIIKNAAQSYQGFTCEGHAGFDEYGHDIVCAGVSALVINTINSIERFTEDVCKKKANEKTGYIRFLFKQEPSKEASLLISSMILGVEEIAKSVGDDYIRIIYKEV